MTEPNTIRGSRIGAGPMGEAERGEGARRAPVSYWCASRHETRPSFAADAVIPETWECPRCGSPAGQDEQNPPRRPQAEPYRTHLAYVKERRSPAEGEAILAEALARLHGAGSRRHDLPGPREPATAVLSAGGARTRGSRGTQDPPRSPGRPGRRAAGARGGDPRPGRREGQGPRAAERALGGDPDLPAVDTPAGAHRQPARGPEQGQVGEPPRDPAGMAPGRTDPPPPGPSADEWCTGCGYKLTAPGHEEHLRGAALGVPAARKRPPRPRPRPARPGAARRDQ